MESEKERIKILMRTQILGTKQKEQEKYNKNSKTEPKEDKGDKNRVSRLDGLSFEEALRKFVITNTITITERV